MWHASIMPLPGKATDKRFMRDAARTALLGVGDARLGEWEEYSPGHAYHIKRRLSTEEQDHVGNPVDIRGTPEQDQRCAAMQLYLPAQIKHWRN